MTPIRLAIPTLAFCLAAFGAWAQATPNPSVAPGPAAPPSVAANRGTPEQGNSAPVHADAPTGPGKAAAPSVAANRGHHRRSHNRAPSPAASSAAQGAGGAASVAQAPSNPGSSPK